MAALVSVLDHTLPINLALNFLSQDPKMVSASVEIVPREVSRLQMNRTEPFRCSTKS